MDIYICTYIYFISLRYPYNTNNNKIRHMQQDEKEDILPIWKLYYGNARDNNKNNKKATPISAQLYGWNTYKHIYIYIKYLEDMYMHVVYFLCGLQNEEVTNGRAHKFELSTCLIFLVILDDCVEPLAKSSIFYFYPQTKTMVKNFFEVFFF